MEHRPLHEPRGGVRMRVPKKREFAAYRLLLEYNEINLGEAVEYLSKNLCVPRRTARNIIKRLKRIGFIEIIFEESEPKLRVKPLPHVLNLLTDDYIEKRSKRCFKGKII